MREFLEFINDEFLNILLFIVLIFLFPLFIIFIHQISKTYIFELEERCFVFYKENNYILDECLEYRNKLEGK